MAVAHVYDFALNARAVTGEFVAQTFAQMIFEVITF
jgi:hypothetical protein